VMKTSQMALSERIADWEAGSDAIFEFATGQTISIPIIALREHGENALPACAGVLKHRRQTWKWTGRDTQVHEDPITAYAASGYAAARDMAELLSAQQAAQVAQSASLADALTTVITGVGDMLSMLVTNAMALQASAGDDQRLEVASQALQSFFMRGKSEPAPADETDVARLCRIARSVGLNDLASKLEADNPNDLTAWVAAHFAEINRAWAAVGPTDLVKLSSRDREWLQALYSRTANKDG